MSSLVLRQFTVTWSAGDHEAVRTVTETLEQLSEEEAYAGGALADVLREMVTSPVSYLRPTVAGQLLFVASVATAAPSDGIDRGGIAVLEKFCRLAVQQKFMSRHDAGIYLTLDESSGFYALAEISARADVPSVTHLVESKGHLRS